MAEGCQPTDSMETSAKFLRLGSILADLCEQVDRSETWSISKGIFPPGYVETQSQGKVKRDVQERV